MHANDTYAVSYPIIQLGANDSMAHPYTVKKNKINILKVDGAQHNGSITAFPVQILVIQFKLIFV